MNERKIKSKPHSERAFATVIQDRGDGKYYKIGFDSGTEAFKIVEVTSSVPSGRQLPFYESYSEPYVWVRDGLSVRIIIRDGRIGYEESTNSSSKPILSDDIQPSSICKLIAPTGFYYGEEIGHLIGATSMTEILMAKLSDVVADGTHTAITSGNPHGSPVLLCITNPNDAAVETFYDGYLAPIDLSLSHIELFSKDPHTGADLIVEALVDGSPFGSAATFTFTDGVGNPSVRVAPANDADYSAGQRIGLRFTQVGSTNPGSGIILTLHMA